MSEVQHTGYYLEPDQTLATLWQEFFLSRGVLLNHYLEWTPVEAVDNGVDFFLIDGDAFSASQNMASYLKGVDKPVFIHSDYVDTDLLKSCLSLGVKGCYDRGTPLGEICDDMLRVLKDVGSQVYNRADQEKGEAGQWVSWEDVRREEGISRLSELSLSKKSKLMGEVFIYEFFRAEGNLTTLADNLGGVTRITVKKYYNQFQREIFPLLINHLPEKKRIPFIGLERDVLVRTMKKQWFYDDFKGFLGIYGNDFEVIEKVMKIPAIKIKQFWRSWNDLFA